MLSSFAKAIAQLADPRLRRVLWRGLAGTLILYVLLHLGIGWAFFHFHFFGLSLLNRVTGILGEIGVFALTLMIFPSIAALVLSFLLEEAAAAVDAAYYPLLEPPRHQGMGEILLLGVRFAGLSLLINLLALPVYLILLLVGIGVGLYYLVNGYLLGRNYYELVALRRLTPAQADSLRRAHGGRILLDGVAIALVSSVPLLNLVAPIIATAFMVHECEILRREFARL